jgi:hypothetical protein
MINAGHPDVAASLGRVSIVWVAGPEVPFTIDNHSYFTVSWRKPMCAACNRLIGNPSPAAKESLRIESNFRS